MQKSLYKNTMFKATLNVFNIVVPILVGPYIMRILTPEQIGNLNFAQSIFSYFFIFASFGVAEYGIRELSRIKNDKKKLESVFSNLFLITLITNVVAFFFYYLFIFIKLKNTEAYFVCQLFTIYFMFNIFQIEWMNIALENFGFITIKTILVKLIYVVCIFLFVKTTKDYNSYIFIIISTTCIGNIISYLYIKKKFKFNFEKIQIKKHLKPMFLMVIISNANVLYTQLDRYMIGEVIGTVILSYYAVAQGIMLIVNSLFMSIVQACTPRMNTYIGNGDKDNYIQLLYKVSRTYFLFLFPTSVGMILLSNELVVLYGGSQYKDAGIVLASFALYMITIGFDSILGNQIMYINKKEKQQVKYIFIGGGINCIFNLILIKLNVFTASTAIISTGLCNALVIIMQANYIKKNLKLNYKILSFNNLKYLYISLIFIPIIILIKILNFNYIVETLLSIAISSGVYFTILYLIKDDIFLMFINKIKGTLRIKLK